MPRRSSVARYSRAARAAASSLSSSGFQYLLEPSAACWRRRRSSQARIDREPLGPDQALRHAALNDALKQMTQRIALAKAAMPVLGKGRVIRNLAVEAEPTEPAIRQIEMDLFAKPPLERMPMQ